MKKAKGFISAVSSISLLLTAASNVFAVVDVPINPPAGSIEGIDIGKIPQFVIQVVFILGIAIAIVFLIWGGIKWILSGGDKAAVESARNHIIAAIIGLVIVAGAFFILQIVFGLLGVTNPLSTGFKLPCLKDPTGATCGQ